MATEIAERTQIIQHYASSLTRPEQDKHRAWIGVRVEALLDPYWDKRPSDIVKREIMLDWMDALEPFTPEEITNACREWLARSGGKPKTGDIRKLIEGDRAWRLSKIPAPPEPERPEPCSPAAAAEIMEKAGFRPKRITGEGN